MDYYHQMSSAGNGTRNEVLYPFSVGNKHRMNIKLLIQCSFPNGISSTRITRIHFIFHSAESELDSIPVMS